ncbi:MAG TPA: MMPL family transporter [Nitrolancea sp.]
MTSWFSTAGLARRSARHPWRVVAIWLVILALGVVAATGLGNALSSDVNLTNSPDSVKGKDLLDARFNGSAAVTETVIVQSKTMTVDDPAFEQQVKSTESSLLGLKGLVSSASSYYDAKAAGLPQANAMVSADRHTTLIPVSLGADDSYANDHANEYMDTINKLNGNGFQVLTVGDVSTNHEFTKISEKDLAKAETIVLPITILILIVVFGALLAAAVPLVLSVFAIVVALGLTALVGRALDLSLYVENMIFMIGFAVGIDYALFIISRYREERSHGIEKIDAITASGRTASKAVLFSGLTVVVALSGMLLMPSTIFHSLGIGAVLVVVSAVVAMLTLVPALLSLLGDRINWPRRIKYDTVAVSSADRFDEESIRSGFWGSLTHAILRRPAIAATIAIILLGAAAIPFFQLNRGMSGVDTLPKSNVKTAYEILNNQFSAGRLAPYEIVVDAQKSSASEAAIGRLTAAIGQDKAFEPNPSVEWNKGNNLALVKVTYTGDANSDGAYTTLDNLRSTIIPTAFQGTQANVYVTGATAFNHDFFKVVDKYTPVIFIWVLGLSFLLLLVAFRSIIVPLKAILLNLLSVGATYGLMVLVFQKGYLHSYLGFQTSPTIEAWVPVFLFCVLFGLSMDYHVFLVSRIREHYDLTQRNHESVAVGLQSTARLITGAALIMVVVFTSFALGRLLAFQQMGFGLAVAIFLDATVVRTVLVPSMMAMLGDLNWYLPKWLNWLPDLRIEGDPKAASIPEAVPELALQSND